MGETDHRPFAVAIAAKRVGWNRLTPDTRTGALEHMDQQAKTAGKVVGRPADTGSRDAG